MHCVKQQQQQQQQQQHIFNELAGSQSQRTSLRSPYTLSTRPVDGQNLAWRTHSAGNAASSREYGWLHSSAVTTSAVWGAFFSRLSCLRNRDCVTQSTGLQAVKGAAQSCCKQANAVWDAMRCFEQSCRPLQDGAPAPSIGPRESWASRQACWAHLSAVPFSMSLISPLMAIMALQKRSISTCTRCLVNTGTILHAQLELFVSRFFLLCTSA